MPQVTHCDLVSFADDKVNLKKTEVDDQRAKVDRSPLDWAPAGGLAGGKVARL